MNIKGAVIDSGERYNSQTNTNLPSMLLQKLSPKFMDMHFLGNIFMSFMANLYVSV